MKTTFRHKLSPKHLNLPSGYRKTAWAEISLESLYGRGRGMEIARFHSSTPGQVEVFATLSEENIVNEISADSFFKLIEKDLKS